MGTESEETNVPKNGVAWWVVCIAIAWHVVLFLVIFIIGSFDTPKGKAALKPEKQEVIIPIDLTVVPPWAKKSDDEKVDSRPKAPKTKPKQKPKQTPSKTQKTKTPKDPKAEKQVPLDSTQVERGAFKGKSKLHKQQPTPTPAPTPEPEVERPPELATKDVHIPDMKDYGLATARENPLPNAKELLNKGYRPSDRNQLATNEAQLGVSLIQAAIRREWDKEQFNWNSNLKKIQVRFQLGEGGMVRGYRILSSSGDSEVDRTAQNALSRLKAKGRIDGLTPNFIKNYPEITILMEPTP